jgi:WD40 repeat protein
MRNKKLLGLCIASAVGLAAPTISQAEGACPLYGVNDGGLNNSQFFTVSETLEVNELGELHEGKDIEALAINGDGVLYAASGDDTDNPGHLYTVDKGTGVLTDKGATGYNEIEGLAFHPTDGTLWAWAKGDGLISIDNLDTTPSFTEILRSSAKVEDITWNPEGTLLYGSQNTNLWVYDKANNSVELKCSNLPGETEALEMLPDGKLLLGIHGEEEILRFQSMNIETCEIEAGVNIPTSSNLNDVEGIAWQSCESEEQWKLYSPELFESLSGGEIFELRKDGEPWDRQDGSYDCETAVITLPQQYKILLQGCKRWGLTWNRQILYSGKRWLGGLDLYYR